MQSITILGSTGSIGMSTLSVIEQNPELFRVEALTARHNVAQMVQQCLAYQPRHAVMLEHDAGLLLSKKLKEAGCTTEVQIGEKALEQIACDSASGTVVAAIVGAAGLLPTLSAVRAGKRVLLANKEALVMAGALFIETVNQSGATLLPIDSEHNALFQCMPFDFQPGRVKPKGVDSVILTASGGPFLSYSQQQLVDVTPTQAIAHPNWSMGPKISVDSATMMNKGLEVIEAHWFFKLPVDQIEVIIHPQSIVHSMVRYRDGSVLAQLGCPDMRIPIANALAWPNRIDAGVKQLDLIATGRLDFSAVTPQQFPCLHLAYEALRLGGTAMSVLNAANEVAVSAFLAQKIGFTEIPHVIDEVLHSVSLVAADHLEIILRADQRAREVAKNTILRLCDNIVT